MNFTFKVFTIAILALSLTFMQCISCPIGWIPHDQLCYKAITGVKATWSVARDMCRNVSGTLVLPTTTEENDFIWDIFRAQYLNDSGGLWLGCSRPEVEGGAWICPKTSALKEFTSWAAHQPNGGNCMVMWYFRSAVWADVKCDVERSIMCERDVCPQYGGHCHIASQDAGPGCLLGHAIEVVEISSPIQCCALCSKNPLCRSFNLRGKMCEINDVKRADLNIGELVSTNEICYYYEINKLP